MKKPLAVFVLLLATSVSAQPVAPVSATFNGQNVVDALNVGRALHNSAICARFPQATPCNQANVCQASKGATGQPVSGAACTAQEALQADIRLYANTNNGLGNFIENEIVKVQIAGFRRQQAKMAFSSLQSFCATATNNQINNMCSATGQANDCGICDNWK